MASAHPRVVRACRMGRVQRDLVRRLDLRVCSMREGSHGEAVTTTTGRRAPKAARKQKHSWTGKPSSVWAVKGKRVAKGLSWMPDEVMLTLDGEPIGKLLEPCGWSIVCDETLWPLDRIEANWKRITESWARDNGSGWRLEIR